MSALGMGPQGGQMGPVGPIGGVPMGPQTVMNQGMGPQNTLGQQPNMGQVIILF